MNRGLLDFLQGASNATAANVSAPVDLIAKAFNKAGVDVGEMPVAGSKWMQHYGLTRPVSGIPAEFGETAGMLVPIVGFSRAPRGLLDTLK